MTNQTFTNYSLLCKVPTEDDKLYYWENFQKLIPFLDPIMKKFKTTKVISWQHFEKIKWNKKEQINRSSSSAAPTGGSNNTWCFDDLKKIFNVYLNDRTFHYHCWNGKNEEIKIPPVNKRGYPFHYSTTILGNIAKIKPDASTDWYNRTTDFRFQIPYYFGQFENSNMLVEFCFRDGWLSKEEMDTLVLCISEVCFCHTIYRRENITTCAFTHTYERIRSDRAEDEKLWTKLK
jgi:hypothetical protein